MKLSKIILEAEKQDLVPDKDPEKNIFNAPRGYVVTRRYIDPATGKSTTELAAEPQILKYAKELREMKKDMKYFNMLPDNDPDYAYLKSAALSIITSLSNAEGKLRSLYEKIQWIQKFKK